MISCPECARIKHNSVSRQITRRTSELIVGRVLHKLLNQFPNISEEDLGYISRLGFKQHKDLLNIKTFSIFGNVKVWSSVRCYLFPAVPA